MQKTIFFLLAVLFIENGIAQQNVAINSTGALPHPSAQLDINSTSKGMLIPRMSTAQRTAITSPATSLMVFDTDTNSFWFYNGTSWIGLSSTLTSWGLNGNTGTTPLTHYIGTNDNADLRFKINSVNAGLLGNNGNIFWGLRSANSITTGSSNIGIGTAALKQITTNTSLIAIGDSSLSNNTTGAQNIAIGSKSLASNTTGGENTAVGYFSLLNNVSGNINTAFGAHTLRLNTTGGGNTAIGDQSMYHTTTGDYNTATGDFTLHWNSTGQNNTAAGAYALANTTGSSNSAFGRASLGNNSTGYSNVAIGAYALFWSSINSNLVAIGDSALLNNGVGASQANQGIYNVAIGSKSLFTNTTGSYNTSLGSEALYYNSTGDYNTASGFQALRSNTTGYWNTAYGLQALFLNTTGNYNTATAVDALHYNTTGQYNTATGYQSLYYNTTGNYNTAHGLQALFSNTTGNYNTAYGLQSMRSNTTGNYNTAQGSLALYSNTTGYSNVAVGVSALINSTSGSNLVAVGDSSLVNNSNGFGNTAVGSKTLYLNGNGYSNTATGFNSLRSNTDGNNNTGNGALSLYNNNGSNNTAIGGNSLNANSNGNDNTAVGAGSLSQNTSGTFNTAVGVSSLTNNISGNYNTALGHSANVNTSLTNATAIGARARVDCNNCMVLGSINGINSATSNVNVGIGTTSPQQMLSVGSSMNVDQSNVNNGTPVSGLSFGSFSGEAIASKRTAGGNQYGLDFYTNSTNRMTIGNSGTVSIGTTTAGSKLLVSGSESTANGGDAAIQITNTAPGSNNTWYFRTGATGTVTPPGALSIADNGAYRFILYNDGNAWLQGTLTQNSDARLKKDIKPLDASLKQLLQLNGYHFYWNDSTSDKTIQTGVLAQEVKLVYPELVKEDQSGHLSVNYIGLIPVLIEAIKEQQKQIDELKKENAEIKNMLKKNN